MNVNVRGKNIDVTPALKDYVEKKITKVAKQFKTVGDNFSSFESGKR